MSSDSSHKRTGVLSNADIADSDCNSVLLEPIGISQECTPNEFTVNCTESDLSAKKLSKCKEPCRNTNVPLLEESTAHVKSKDDFGVSVDVINANQSDNLTSLSNVLDLIK